MMFLIGGPSTEYSTTPDNWTNMLDHTRVTPSGVVEMASCLVGACVCVAVGVVGCVVCARSRENMNN